MYLNPGWGLTSLLCGVSEFVHCHNPSRMFLYCIKHGFEKVASVINLKAESHALRTQCGMRFISKAAKLA